MTVSQPPREDAAAVVDITAVTEKDVRINEPGGILCGTVSRISLERSSGQVFATINVGAQTFVVKLTSRQVDKQSLFPGTRVFLHYYPDQVKWI